MTNTNIITILIFIALYLDSARYNYKWYRTVFSKSDDPSKDGAWSNTDADFWAFLFTFMPVLNIFAFIINLFESPYRLKKKKEKTKNYWFNKFFKVKK